MELSRSPEVTWVTNLTRHLVFHDRSCWAGLKVSTSKQLKVSARASGTWLPGTWLV